MNGVTPWNVVLSGVWLDMWDLNPAPRILEAISNLGV